MSQIPQVLVSELSRNDILQHRPVERQVGDETLELGILLLELAQSLHLRGHRSRRGGLRLWSAR